jgi:hypothetical protein
VIGTHYGVIGTHYCVIGTHDGVIGTHYCGLLRSPQARAVHRHAD